MIFFLLIFFTVYGSMNLYVLLKIKMLLQISIKYIVLLSIIMVVMTVLPVITSRLLKTEYILLTEVFYYIAYSWMGLLFLFISVSLLFDLFLLFSFLIENLTRINISFTKSISKSVFFYAPLIISVLIFIYGYFEGKNIVIKEVVIQTDKLPENVNEITIAQITDVHLGTIVKRTRFENIVNILKEINADIIVSTGDMLDRTYLSKNKIDKLNTLETKYGKFAVLGNHEFYIGEQESLEFMKSSNFKVLRNEYVTVENKINIIGYDDELFNNPSPQDNKYIDIDNDLFTLAMKHRPEIKGNNFDLFIAGHTHKGQIFPMILVLNLIHNWTGGLYELEQGGKMYVNPGTGLWGPPIRFLARPEITLFRIKNSLL